MPFPSVPTEYNPYTPLPQAKPDVPQGYYHPLTGKWVQQGDAGFNPEFAQSVASGGDPNQSFTVLPDGQSYIGQDAARAQGGIVTNAPGSSPFFGFGDNSPTFVSSDPNEINRYQDNARTRSLQGIAKVGALVGGGAALGGTQWGSGAPSGQNALTGSATVSGSNAAAGSVAPSAASYAPQFSAANLGATGASWGAPTAAAGGAAGGATSAAGIPWASGFGAAPAASGGWLDRWLPYINQGGQALLGAYGANQAAGAESDALQGAIDEQRRQYDLNRQDMMPWLTAGQGAVAGLQDPANSFAASPGYDWRRNEGQRDIGNSFAARGGAASGNALRALSEYNQGLASSEYGNWWDQQSRLAGLGQNTAVNLGNQGQNTAGNIGNAMAGQGVSRASGIANRYGALGQGLNDSLSWLWRRRQGG